MAEELHDVGVTDDMMLINEDSNMAANAHVEESHSDEASSGIGTLGINAPIFLAQLLNFIIVLVVLWRFAYKPLVKKLEARSEKIEHALKSAEESEKQLEEIRAEKEEIVNEARAEASKIIESARADAEARKAELSEKAKAEVKSVLEAGKAQLKMDKETMIREAREELADIAVSASKKILEGSIDESRSKSLAQKAIESLI